MPKFKFAHRWEWSDFSEYSPSHWGQLPIAVILPDGERVGLGAGDLEPARYNFYRQFESAPEHEHYWIPLAASVKFRLYGGMTDAAQRTGRGKESLHVLAPENSQFVFRRFCPHCGEPSSEEIHSGEFSGRAEPEYHEKCRRIVAEMEAEQEKFRWRTVTEIAEELGIEYNTLVKAVREHRVDGHKSGGTWLTCVAEVEHARDEGRLRV